MNNKYLITAVTLLALPIGSAFADAKFDKMMKDSFQANGIATLDRLNQDAAQKYCSDPATLAGKGDPKRAEAIQKANMATIKQPADGKYIGDIYCKSNLFLTWDVISEGEVTQSQVGRVINKQTRIPPRETRWQTVCCLI